MSRRTLTEALDILCELITEMKQSYFSPTGKPWGNWDPLKPRTIARKKDNKMSFNTETGSLRNSINTTYEIKSDSISIKCEAIHQDGDAAIAGLIYKYGRNFLDFDEEEMQLIGTKLISLLNGDDE